MTILLSYRVQLVSSFQRHLHCWQDNGFLWPKNKHKRIALWEQIDKPRMQTERSTYLLFR